MALVKCPDCGKMVSSRVTACPECGCPAEYFPKETDNQVDSSKVEDTKETEGGVEFHFKGHTIKYPKNSEKYAALYGDYVKLGFDKLEALSEEYRRLLGADRVVEELPGIAQRMIDSQIMVILDDLYQKGVSMTINQFKDKYSELPLSYEPFMEPFMLKYDEILGRQQSMANDRDWAYATRMRWSGGGFGMAGAIKGAMSAGVLNIGSSILSGAGNMVTKSLDESIIDNKKDELYRNKEIMVATCQGIVVCMNALFIAYTRELAALNILGNTIQIDLEAAETKYETAMSFERDKEKLFTIVVDCLSLYPSSKTYYDAVEMELDQCEDWEKFKKFWHLEFLYNPVDDSIMKTDAYIDFPAHSGVLKLVQGRLIFTGNNPKDSKEFEIDKIKKIEGGGDFFRFGYKGKFLMYCFHSDYTDLWADTIEKAQKGIYEKVYVQTIKQSEMMKKTEANNKEMSAKEYIKANFTTADKSKAVVYFRQETGASLFDAKNIVDQILGD